MHDWLASRAAVAPEATALVDAEDGTTWDFASLDAEVTALAERLAGIGVGAGDRIGAVLTPDVDAVRLVHAAVRLGATLAPMNERLTADELGGLVDTADPTVLVCDGETVDTAVDAAGDAPVPVAAVERTDRGGVAVLPDVAPGATPDVDRTLDDVRLLMFTSGTTGRPKAVRLTTRNLAASAVASAFRLGFDPADRWLVTLSPCHMGGISPILRMPLYGMAVVLRSEFDADRVAADVADHGVSCVSLVPTMLRRLVDAGAVETLSDGLRVVLLGGAPASSDLLDRCFAAGVPVFPTYGMTETASQIATARPDEAAAHAGTVGRPLLWTDLSVRDTDGDPVPRGETGELVVSGPTVTPGYVDDAATDDAFGPHGLRTGDVGYRDEAGRVWVLNRVDDRIVTGGENVDPGEVAAVLTGHPDVEDAVVVGLPDEEWGERVAALVVADADLTAADVEAYCRERLAGFKRPKTIRFVDELPRTPSGTVERASARELLSTEE